MDELYDPNQERIREINVTNENAYAVPFMMFCRGRKDVYDLRYDNPKTGKKDIIPNAIILGSMDVIRN